MRKQFTFSWAGKFKTFVLCWIPLLALANGNSTEGSAMSWSEYNRLTAKAIQEDRQNGTSYIISGGIALLGGLVGAGVTSDPIERGIYVVFQSIGVASIGYGAYKWKIGDEDRLLVSTLRMTEEMNEAQRTAFLRNYLQQKKERESRERVIKAVTHGLIAALNLYNASQQSQELVKNSLYFIGGVNLLASISYTF